MEVIKVHGDYLDENTYILVFSKECVIIDAGVSYERISKILDFLSLKCVAVLLTHGHFDHISGVKSLQDAGAKVYIHKDAEDMVNSSGNLAKSIGIVCQRFKGDCVFDSECEITVADNTFEVIETPGHADGSVCYKIDDMLFTGDTLFKNSYGATHFRTGDYNKLKNSIINKIFTIKDNLKIFTGHDTDINYGDKQIDNPYNEYIVYAAPCTMLMEEKLNNPILYGS